MSTVQQIRAYRLAILDGHTQAEVANLMGISQQAVSRLLSRLKRDNPKAFPNKITTPKKNLTYCPQMDYRIKRNF